MNNLDTIHTRPFIGIIGDEDSVTGFLLAGIGHIDNEQKKNFLVVGTETETSVIETFFEELTDLRTDIGIILINQHIADRIRPKIDAYSQTFPSLLEIPSKDHPYDMEKDFILKRVKRLMGDET